MRFGPRPPERVPEQDYRKILLMGERWQRASWAHNTWATTAKRAVDFFEGRQWTATQLAEFALKRRPALQFNIIAPLIRLVLGYQRNNKTDIQFQPGSDLRATEETAETLSQLAKQIAQMNQLQFVDTEVFLDGLISARGYFRTELDFRKNDLGDTRIVGQDPFATYPDPDCDTYDFNESASFLQTSRWVSIDELEAMFGKGISDLLRPYTSGRTPIAPLSTISTHDEVSPVRWFGNREDDQIEWWDDFYSLMGDFVDTRRKSLRIIETEHKVTETANVFIDLETGDKEIVPKHWTRPKVEKVLFYANEVLGNPVVVERRQVERMHWTTICADMLLYDAPSPYETFTITPFFPYFRRGFTRGVVEDLIDPQIEKNKRRSTYVEIVSKTSNGGWSFHEDSLSNDQEHKLKRFGAAPGFMLKWKGEHEPKQITPAVPPAAHDRLEEKSDDDVHQISGINEAAIGELDVVQSGRALEARQRQAVISIQLYMDNFVRSKTLLGAKKLEVVQNHYTERRLIRLRGEDKKLTAHEINKQVRDHTGAVRQILNDVTVGKYDAIVDEAPLSASFANAQFEEMLTILEKLGPAIGPYIPMFADLIVDLATLPRKTEWTERLQSLMSAMGLPAGPSGGPMLPTTPGGLPNAPFQAGSVPAGQGNVIPISASA